MSYWTVMFAGIWPFIWHLGLSTIAIAACLAWAWFMPVFKTTALWIAAAIFLTTSAYVWGAKDGEYRVQSKWDEVNREDQEAATAAAMSADHVCVTPGCLRHDKYNRDTYGK